MAKALGQQRLARRNTPGISKDIYFGNPSSDGLAGQTTRMGPAQHIIFYEATWNKCSLKIDTTFKGSALDNLHSILARRILKPPPEIVCKTAGYVNLKNGFASPHWIGTVVEDHSRPCEKTLRTPP